MKAQNLIQLIGNTPLLRLDAASDATGCEILGKCEFLNPGQSVKDRAALSIIRNAEKSGLLKKGDTIIEGTAGNTGIGLAMIANVLGYKTKIVIPKTQSEEKKQAIRLYGAELIETDAAPYSSPLNYVRYSGQLALETGAFWANQFDNIANKQAHIDTTGPEIWAQTDGKIDGFICAVGSGGTLAGISQYLRHKNSNIKIGLADPMGAALFNYYKTGELKSEGGSITEGIGQGRITKNLEGFEPDFAYQIKDEEWLPIIFELLKNEGLVMGGSTGVNIAGAIKLARELGPGHTIVTMLCDYGNRYASKIFNLDFLREKNLPLPN